MPKPPKFYQYPISPRLVSCLTLTCLVILSGCTQLPVRTEVESPPIAEARKQVDDRPFGIDTLYSLLVAELAGERHRFDIMLSNYVDQAETTLDPGVAARAARLARYLTAHNSALDMALLWLDLEPENAEAHYLAAAELVYANRLLEAVGHAQFLLEHDEVTGFDAIGAKAQQGGDLETTKQLISAFQPLVEAHPEHTPLQLGISLLYQHAGELEKALNHAQLAIKQEPEDFQAAAHETRILQQLGRTEQALNKLGELVERHPENARLRLQYARALLKTDLALAQNQFETLLNDTPGDVDLILTLALIQYERGLLEEAKLRFNALLQYNSHQSTAHYYLGRIALVQKADDLAVEHFSAVQSGADYLPAMSQLTEVMLGKGKGKQALTMVREQRDNTPATQIDQIEGLYLLESHLLSSQGQYPESLTTLHQGITQFPESTRLIYTRAMLFTQLNKLEKAEQDFHRVLVLTPDNAAALNAWGYTLADRTDRIEEAYTYIRKAYQLTPNDPAVMDSLGWVEYRRGNNALALETLRRAMDAMPDHEIAAHLGEVLWVTGNKQEALVIWHQGLKLKPQSTVIRSTMTRFNVEHNNPPTAP